MAINKYICFILYATHELYLNQTVWHSPNRFLSSVSFCETCLFQSVWHSSNRSLSYSMALTKYIYVILCNTHELFLVQTVWHSPNRSLLFVSVSIDTFSLTRMSHSLTNMSHIKSLEVEDTKWHVYDTHFIHVFHRLFLHRHVSFDTYVTHE